MVASCVTGSGNREWCSHDQCFKDWYLSRINRSLRVGAVTVNSLFAKGTSAKYSSICVLT